MKSVKKGLSVNRIVGTLKRRTGTSSAANSSNNNNNTGSGSGPSNEAPTTQGLAIPDDLQEDTPEGIAVRNVKAFCESGGPNRQARRQGDEVLFLPPIHPQVSDGQVLTKASLQYNAVMLMRILADNPGRSSPDLVYMVEEEKERALQRGERNFRYPQGAHSAPQMTASQYNEGGHNSNYFARSHSNRRLPRPAELASRLEEARSSAKLLSQVFADRCQSATRSIQLYMLAEDPAPDNDTMESLIDANEQLQTALNQHQRGVLNARKQLGLNSTPSHTQQNTFSAEMTNGQPPVLPLDTRPQQHEQQWLPSQPTSAPQQPPRKPLAGSNDDSQGDFAPPAGPPPGLPPKDRTFESGGGGDPFQDPAPAPLRGAPPVPGFNPTQSYVGRQDSAVGHTTMHGAQGSRNTRDDDDIYDSR
ncbi:hypothetical protein EV126DRAFT_447367 [Verticillium dahliae]|nr:hypothetical protein EV126DRAFT_447367 [Verticillium dahliae]